MGVIVADPDVEEYSSLPDKVQEAAEKTLEALGVNEHSVFRLVEMRDDGATAVVSVILPPGEGFDLTEPTFPEYGDDEGWDYYAHLMYGRVESADRLSNGGWRLTLAVRGRY